MLNTPSTIPRQVNESPRFDSLEGATKRYRLRNPGMTTEQIAKHLSLQQGVRPIPSSFLFGWTGYESLAIVRTKREELSVFLIHWRDFHEKLREIADEVVSTESEETHS